MLFPSFNSYQIFFLSFCHAETRLSFCTPFIDFFHFYLLLKRCFQSMNLHLSPVYHVLQQWMCLSTPSTQLNGRVQLSAPCSDLPLDCVSPIICFSCRVTSSMQLLFGMNTVCHTSVKTQGQVFFYVLAIQHCFEPEN